MRFPHKESNNDAYLLARSCNCLLAHRVWLNDPAVYAQSGGSTAPQVRMRWQDFIRGPGRSQASRQLSKSDCEDEISRQQSAELGGFSSQLEVLGEHSRVPGDGQQVWDAGFPEKSFNPAANVAVSTLPGGDAGQTRHPARPRPIPLRRRYGPPVSTHPKARNSIFLAGTGCIFITSSECFAGPLTILR